METTAVVQDQPHESFVGPVSETKPQAKSSRKYFAYQLLAFFFTALLYSLSHALRTVWGYVKPTIIANDPDYFSTSKLGTLDFTFMMAYAIGQYVNGYLGDRINLKVFLTAGMGIACTGLSLFAYLEGFAHVHNIFLDMFAFILNGLGQSTVFYSFISIIKCVRDIQAVCLL